MQDFAEIVLTMPAERLPNVVEAWLWEFHDPGNWPSGSDAWKLIRALEARPDASSDAVKTALADCHEYLRGCGT